MSRSCGSRLALIFDVSTGKIRDIEGVGTLPGYTDITPNGLNWDRPIISAGVTPAQAPFIRQSSLPLFRLSPNGRLLSNSGVLALRDSISGSSWRAVARVKRAPGGIHYLTPTR